MKKMTTIVVQIGNSDDKLRQVEWSEFVEEVAIYLVNANVSIHFHACSEGSMKWQNACWVGSIQSRVISKTVKGLSDIRKKWQQESVAVMIGETKFV